MCTPTVIARRDGGPSSRYITRISQSRPVRDDTVTSRQATCPTRRCDRAERQRDCRRCGLDAALHASVPCRWNASVLRRPVALATWNVMCCRSVHNTYHVSAQFCQYRCLTFVIDMLSHNIELKRFWCGLKTHTGTPQDEISCRISSTAVAITTAPPPGVDRPMGRDRAHRSC